MALEHAMVNGIIRNPQCNLTSKSRWPETLDRRFPDRR
jgi:hypothetical protein